MQYSDEVKKIYYFDFFSVYIKRNQLNIFILNSLYDLIFWQVPKCILNML